MMNELYNQRILKLAAEISHIGRLDNAAAQADAQSRLCGSKVHVELSLADDNTVAAFAHEVEACALGQASSSVMAREIIGARPARIARCGGANARHAEARRAAATRFGAGRQMVGPRSAGTGAGL
jgi:NifU-like protein involved in Fe-S cluster formation